MTPKEAEHFLNSFHDMPEQIAQLRDEITALYTDMNAASAPALSGYFRKEIEIKQSQLEQLQHTTPCRRFLQSCPASITALSSSPIWGLRMQKPGKTGYVVRLGTQSLRKWI